VALERKQAVTQRAKEQTAEENKTPSVATAIKDKKFVDETGSSRQDIDGDDSHTAREEKREVAPFSRNWLYNVGEKGQKLKAEREKNENQN